MPESDSKRRCLIGTGAYDNWRAFIDGEPLLETYEYLMYTDAWLTGEVATGLEPYSFFNLVPFVRERGRVRAAVALRLSLHVAFDAPEMNKTDQLRYHGGSMTDEIAALASLRCGVRFRPGGETRRFDVGGDPKGRPVAWSARPEPTLGIGIRGFVLPAVGGEHSMMPIADLKSFPSLTPDQAITLVRVARLYQDALWLAESEPNLSWLMLVAAVETAAGLWRSGANPPIDRMRESRSDFVAYLEGLGVPGLADRVANEFADSIGSTKKFVDFLLEHLPPAPEKRPAEWGQVEWSTDNLRRIFRQIYGYRSKALHDGMPFPAPMCEPPFRHESWEAVAERPIGLAASTLGGTWIAEDTPVLLHTFEYVARHAINSWWASMATAADRSTMTKSERTCCDGPHPFDSRRIRDSWWPRELRCLLIGESPGPPGAAYFYDPVPDDAPDPIVVRRHLLAGLAATGLIKSPTLEAFRAAGFAFDHAIRCQLPTETIRAEHKLARRYSSPRAHAAAHLASSIGAARQVWILGHIARDALTHVARLQDRRTRITPPYVLQAGSRVFVSQYFRRFDSPAAVLEIIERFRAFFAVD